MDKKKWFLICSNALFAVLIIAFSQVFLYTSISSYITKTISSVLFLLCGVFNFVCCMVMYKQNTNFWFSLLLVIGLFFAVLGDILLIDFFIIGAIFFAIGHIFYIVAFCFIKKFKLKDLLCGTIIFFAVFMLIQFYPHFNFDGMKILILLYALIISFMLGKAISNLIEKNQILLNILIFFGAFLFFFSDAMLLFYNFAGKNIIFDILCVTTYYIGQFILASSVFVQLVSKK